MGVEVAENQEVTEVGEVEDWIDVEMISAVAGRGRRNIAVQDVDGLVVDGCRDALDFQMIVVGDGGDVEMGVAERVMDQGDETSTSTARTVEADDCVVAEVGITRRGGEFGLLKTGDDDVAGV